MKASTEAYLAYIGGLGQTKTPSAQPPAEPRSCQRYTFRDSPVPRSITKRPLLVGVRNFCRLGIGVCSEEACVPKAGRAIEGLAALKNFSNNR